MKRSGLNTVNASFFLIIAAGNIVSCLSFRDPFWIFFSYTAPFILASIFIYLMKNRITPKITAWIFLCISLYATFNGGNGDLTEGYGNLTGAIFLCFALYLFKNRKIAIISGITTSLVILGKAVISLWTVPQTINFISGYIYILIIYWILHSSPKIKVEMSSDDYETADIVMMMINGLSYKEIADRMDVSASAISKRLERARGRIGAKSNEHLAILMSRSGQIVIE